MGMFPIVHLFKKEVIQTGWEKKKRKKENDFIAFVEFNYNRFFQSIIH